MGTWFFSSVSYWFVILLDSIAAMDSLVKSLPLGLGYPLSWNNAAGRVSKWIVDWSRWRKEAAIMRSWESICFFHHFFSSLFDIPRSLKFCSASFVIDLVGPEKIVVEIPLLWPTGCWYNWHWKCADKFFGRVFVMNICIQLLIMPIWHILEIWRLDMYSLEYDVKLEWNDSLFLAAGLC